MTPPGCPPGRLPVLVTGSSTGLGLETALHLAARGLDVYAGVRDISKGGLVMDAAAARSVTLKVLELDVTDGREIDDAVECVVSTSGTIYGLVNNAGIGLRGCFEDLNEAEIRRVFEANVFGTMALTRQVLPRLRAAGRGRILTVTSIGGRISTFGLSAYCASKFALEGFGEALALETAPFGIQSVLIEPGIVNNSRWSVNKGIANGAMNPASRYYDMFLRAEALADAVAARSRTREDDVARAVYHALTCPRPRMRYVVGRPASVALALRRYLPNRLFERFYFGFLLRRVAPGMAGL